MKLYEGRVIDAELQAGSSSLENECSKQVS